MRQLMQSNTSGTGEQAGSIDTVRGASAGDWRKSVMLIGLSPSRNLTAAWPRQRRWYRRLPTYRQTPRQDISPTTETRHGCDTSIILPDKLLLALLKDIRGYHCQRLLLCLRRVSWQFAKQLRLQTVGGIKSCTTVTSAAYSLTTGCVLSV